MDFGLKFSIKFCIFKFLKWPGLAGVDILLLPKCDIESEVFPVRGGRYTQGLTQNIELIRDLNIDPVIWGCQSMRKRVVNQCEKVRISLD